MLTTSVSTTMPSAHHLSFPIARRPEGQAPCNSPAPWSPYRLRSLGLDGQSKDGCQLAADAIACAEWLEAAGISELTFVGPFGSHSLAIGDIVIVRAGARTYSTRPSVPRSGTVSIRSKQVKIVRLSVGCVDRSCSPPAIRNPSVTWAGHSGYWCWTDLNNLIGYKRPSLAAR